MLFCLSFFKLSAVVVDIVISENPKTYSWKKHILGIRKFTPDMKWIPKHKLLFDGSLGYVAGVCCRSTLWCWKILRCNKLPPSSRIMSYFVCFFWPWWFFSILCCWEESPYKVVLPTASSESVLVFFDVLVSCCFVVLRWVPLLSPKMPGPFFSPRKATEQFGSPLNQTIPVFFAIHLRVYIPFITFQSDRTKPNHCQWRQKSLQVSCVHVRMRKFCHALNLCPKCIQDCN